MLWFVLPLTAVTLLVLLAREHLDGRHNGARPW
jgi:hypothetical protein